MNVKRFVAACLVAVVSLAASGVAFAAEKAPTGKINLNTASAEQLSALPGVGPKLAARIVEHRQKEGSFKTAQELMNVQIRALVQLFRQQRVDVITCRKFLAGQHFASYTLEQA